MPLMDMRFLSPPTALATATAAAALYLYSKRRNRSKLPLPPGPPGCPLIGNVFDLPAEEFWLQYAQWAREYGASIECG